MTKLPSLLPSCVVSLLSATSFHTPSASGLAFSPQQLMPQNFQLPNPFNPPSKKSTFTYTHLECNGQLWQISTPASNNNNNDKPLSIVVDPLASQLDFGIPWGYRANKRVLSESSTLALLRDASPTHCLLTMGLDDHTHLPTLKKLKEACPDLNYVVAPTCEKKLLEAGFDERKITVLRHGQSCDLRLTEDDEKNDAADSRARVTATVGALVGPPWQTRENGYLLQLPASSSSSSLSIYYEPHADTLLPSLRQNSLRAQIVISPVTRQSLPARVPSSGQYTLVYGGERTLEIGEALSAKVFIPLGNGALDVEGPLAGLVEASGGVDDFERLVEERNARVVNHGAGAVMTVKRAEPGTPVEIMI